MLVTVDFNELKLLTTALCIPDNTFEIVFFAAFMLVDIAFLMLDTLGIVSEDVQDKRGVLALDGSHCTYIANDSTFHVGYALRS